MQQTDSTFEQYREELQGLAYRMLGTLSDAEDVLQDAFLRWSKEDRTNVEHPRAYLYSLVTRLCIDEQRKRASRRTEYIGPWLPEPVVTRTAENPEERAEQTDSISMAFLFALERLTPAERAAFLLRKVFDYEYDDIADVLQKSATNCRQLVSRAEKLVHDGRPRFVVDKYSTEQLTASFLSACETGDLSGVVSLLADDVVLYSDGGGKVSAALAPIYGSDRVARFFLGLLKKFPGCYRSEPRTVNGVPGLLTTFNGAGHSVMSFEVVNGRIQNCFIVRNPDKLSSLVEISS